MRGAPLKLLAGPRWSSLTGLVPCGLERVPFKWTCMANRDNGVALINWHISGCQGHLKSLWAPHHHPCPGVCGSKLRTFIPCIVVRRSQVFTPCLMTTTLCWSLQKIIGIFFTAPPCSSAVPVDDDRLCKFLAHGKVVRGYCRQEAQQLGSKVVPHEGP